MQEEWWYIIHKYIISTSQLVMPNGCCNADLYLSKVPFSCPLDRCCLLIVFHQIIRVDPKSHTTTTQVSIITKKGRNNIIKAIQVSSTAEYTEQCKYIKKCLLKCELRYSTKKQLYCDMVLSNQI
jgi:hypothetical protein